MNNKTSLLSKYEKEISKYKKEISSNYQKKTLEEREYNLEDITCPHCDHVFMIDFSYLSIVYDSDDYAEYYKITCPYCGKRTLMAS